MTKKSPTAHQRLHPRPATEQSLPCPPSQLTPVASCFHIITDEWAALISFWLWETEPFRCDKGFMQR